jgi:hypothetical protein
MGGLMESIFTLTVSDLTPTVSGPESVFGFGGIGTWLTGGRAT